MVRLVLRPYTQIRRSICTSEPLRTSIELSLDFVLFRHSSPSFGSQSVRSNSTTEWIPVMGWCCWHEIEIPHRHITDTKCPTFIAPLNFQHSMTCVHLKLLGPCFKTGQMGDRLNTELRQRNTRQQREWSMPNTCVEQKPLQLSTSATKNQPHLTIKHICHPQTQVSHSKASPLRLLQTTWFERFGALCTQVHHQTNEQLSNENFAEFHDPNPPA